MKRLISPAIISAIAFMTACTTEEIVSGPGIDVTVNVNSVPGSRADAIEVPDGYSFKCIMQLVKDDGTKVKQETADVSAGKVSFKILGEDIDKNDVTQALFWAEYVPNSGEKVYNTNDLTNVTYTTTSFDLSKTAEIKACEAFAGTLAIDRKTSASTASVTLSRPMSLVSFCPKNADNLAKAKTIAVSYSTFNGYNVQTKSCAGNDESVTMRNSSFTSTANPWWQIYVLAPEGKTKIDKDIKFSLTGEGMVDFEHTIAANTLPLSANKKYNVTATLTSASTADINVEVTVDPNWDSEETPGDTPIDPGETETVPLALGVMVDNQGRGTTDASKAVGTVVHMYNSDDSEYPDDISQYPTEFSNKSIKAFVLSFESINAVGGTNVPLAIATNVDYSTVTSFNNHNGSLMTSNVLTTFSGSAFANQYATWTSTHALTGDNVSGWYIPSINQLGQWLYAIQIGTFVNPSNEEALYSIEKLCPEGSTLYYISSSAPNSGNGFQTKEVTNEGDFKISPMNSSQEQVTSVICYPMFTIFE